MEDFINVCVDADSFLEGVLFVMAKDGANTCTNLCVVLLCLYVFVYDSGLSTFRSFEVTATRTVAYD